MSFKASGPKLRPERAKPVSSPSTSQSQSRSGTRSRTSSTSSLASTSSTLSFHSARNNPYTDPVPNSPVTDHRNTASSNDRPSPFRFSPSQEALHLSESNTIKSQANTQFAKGDFSSALSTYDKAIAALPTYLDYELAVLQSNIAACHVRLEEWKDAIKAADKGWDCLEILDPTKTDDKNDKDKDEDSKSDSKSAKNSNTKKKSRDVNVHNADTSATVIELPDSTDPTGAPTMTDEEFLRNLELSDQRKTDVRRIRTKILLRRARARYMLGTTTSTSTSTSTSSSRENKNPFAQAQAMASAADPSSSSTTSTTATSAWSNLTAAQSDYQILSQPLYFKILPPSDQRTVRTALTTLPGLVEKAKEKEVAEMMGKLKDLGNGILRPFGLSTDMFKMEKDPNTGGMSLKFDGGARK